MSAHWPIVHPGRVTSAGDLIFNAETLAAKLRRVKPCDVSLVLERLGATRSLRANRAWWGVTMKALSEHTGYTPEECHELVKVKFLTQKLLVAHQRTGEVVEEITIGTSTRRLDSQQFTDLMDRVQRWAAEELGIVIPDPDQRLRTVEDL